ncbi:hypothetical protein TNIN_33081, partial [Trichonephila inaurata madagascariensis]
MTQRHGWLVSCLSRLVLTHQSFLLLAFLIMYLADGTPSP